MEKIKKFIKYWYKKVSLGVILFLVIYFLPLTIISISNRKNITSSIEDLPQSKYAIVFGALVYDSGELTPVMKERIEAGILLYNEDIVDKLYISGTYDHEVGNIASYAIDHGVAEEDIVLDYNGIDTNDTCRHFDQQVFENEPILLTQSFHLSRAMYMCNNYGLKGTGLEVNKLGLIDNRGTNKISIYYTRLKRTFKEGILTWSYILGVYDKLSDESPY